MTPGDPRTAASAPRLEPEAVARFRIDLARLCGPEQERLLLAVSGGADSLALLLLAHVALGSQAEVATVDHGLRREAGEEAAFVGRVCANLGLRHTVLAGPLPTRAGRTANLSARARLLRYQLLERHRAETGCRWIATAHHADDQLETMVMRLNRGAGLGGVAGIRPVVGDVVRPLLGWRRIDLERIVATCGFQPVRDPSNVDDRFDRARVRKELASSGWLGAERWATSASALAEAEDALAWCARALAAGRITVRPEGVELRLADEPPELTRRLVTECLLRVRPEAELRGSEVRRLVERLQTATSGPRATRATLAEVLVVVRADATEVVALFAPAPKRSQGSSASEFEPVRSG